MNNNVNCLFCCCPLFIIYICQIFQSRATLQLFVGCIPFAEVNRDNISDSIFDSFPDAEKDSQKSGNSFRRRLVSICQEEFVNSTANVCIVLLTVAIDVVT